MTRRDLSVVAFAGLVALHCTPSPVAAQSYLGVNLRPFAILGATPSVTCTGGSIVTGDVGISPAALISGFPVPCTIVGTQHPNDAAAIAAQGDLTTAFNTLTAQSCGLDLTGTNLGGLTLTPGVYCFSSSAAITGTLTLNAQGNPNAVWVFQTGTTLTTAGDVAFINGGNPCGAQWRIGSSATIGSGSNMAGNILAQISITLVSGADLIGRALARTGTVTMDNNNVSFGTCGVGGGAAGAPAPFPIGPPLPPVPTLAQWAVIAMAALLVLAGVTAMRRRKA